MDRYTTALTQNGNESFVFDHGDTFCICVGENHVENAETIAGLLNEAWHAETILGPDVGENGAG